MVSMAARIHNPHRRDAFTMHATALTVEGYVATHTASILGYPSAAFFAARMLRYVKSCLAWEVAADRVVVLTDCHEGLSIVLNGMLLLFERQLLYLLQATVDEGGLIEDAHTICR